ncbi:MAG: hypothetical protein JWO04_2143 [Gammaproteobacteria bacterium]|nr:hypothetical protein [Gammaproteobacteria bacterium]
MVNGSCYCGTVRYEVSGPFIDMVNCHCSILSALPALQGCRLRYQHLLQGEPIPVDAGRGACGAVQASSGEVLN